MKALQDEGFTVLELLIALSIFGLVMAGLLGASHLSQRTLLSAEEINQQIAEGAQLRSLLLDALRRLSPSLTPGASMVRGDTTFLTLLAGTPRAIGADTPMTVTFRAGDGGAGLIGIWHAASAVGSGNSLQYNIVTRERAVRFAYRGEQGWLDRWGSDVRAPSLVRAQNISVPSGVVLAEIFVAPQVLMPATCAIDASPPACRGVR